LFGRARKRRAGIWLAINLLRVGVVAYFLYSQALLGNPDKYDGSSFLNRASGRLGALLAQKPTKAGDEPLGLLDLGQMPALGYEF
jgi:hypothetical protein